ncbi:MAG: tetratricopeptide repeat protein [Promethearchaeota archaeon]|nr:MAG: tetratricopeptide repeat protein [Candidatus Lokiarchaeota archaeon]
MTFPCPYCRKEVPRGSVICPHCNKPLLSDFEKIDEDQLNSKNLNTYGKQYGRDPSIAPYLDDPYKFSDDEEREISFDVNEIKDEKIERELKRLEQQIDNEQIYGGDVGDLLLQKAGLYHKMRDLTRSLETLENALKVFESEDNHLKIGIAHNEIGLIKEQMGYLEDSIYHFEQSIRIIKNLGDTKKLLSLYNNIGNAYFQIKDLEKAYNYYQHAIDLAEREGLTFEEIKSSSNLIEVLFELGNYDRIKRILNRNLDYFQKKNDYYGLILTYIKYGKLYFNLGNNYNKAYNYLLSSKDFITEIEENISIYLKAKLEWEIYFYLGKIELLWENIKKAESYLLKSLECVRTFEIGNENYKEGMILEALGNIYILKEEYDAAKEYIQLASDIYYRYGEDIKTAELKAQIASIFHSFSHDDFKAIDFYEEALKIYENSNYFKEAAKIYQKLGDLYLTKNITDVAISQFKKAKSIYEQLKDRFHTQLMNEKIQSLKQY